MKREKFDIARCPLERLLAPMLHAWETGSDAKGGVRKWIEIYNHKRPHSALGGKPPAVVYWQRTKQPNLISKCKE